MVFDLTKYKSIKDRIIVCRYEEGNLVEVADTNLSGNMLISQCYSGVYVLVDSKKYIQDLNLFIK